MDTFNGKRRKFLEPVIDARKIPGYASRFAKLGDVAPQLQSLSSMKSENPDVGVKQNLARRFNSGSNEHTLPSIILRRRGLK